MACITVQMSQMRGICPAYDPGMALFWPASDISGINDPEDWLDLSLTVALPLELARGGFSWRVCRYKREMFPIPNRTKGAARAVPVGRTPHFS